MPIPNVIPAANASNVTRMLLVKISLESADFSDADRPRSVPSRGSVNCGRGRHQASGSTGIVKRPAACEESRSEEQCG